MDTGWICLIVGGISITIGVFGLKIAFDNMSHSKADVLFLISIVFLCGGLGCVLSAVGFLFGG